MLRLDENMNGYLLLAGGAEFGGDMAVADRRAITLAGGPDAPIAIIPTAAAPDNNHARAGENGRRWFAGLGVRAVSVVPLLDATSANATDVVDAVRRARLIYLLGGFPHYLERTLAGSQAWQAMVMVYRAGGVIAGSSAGAMVLCEHYYDPGRGQVETGLGLVPAACVLPHHNTFGRRWAADLARQLPGVTLMGIDERVGMINDGPAGSWQVYGPGAVTRYHHGQPVSFRGGQTFQLAGT